MIIPALRRARGLAAYWVRLLDARSGNVVETFKGHQDGILGFALSKYVAAYCAAVQPCSGR